MPNIAKVLKDEICRVSRKEVKAAVAPVQKTGIKMRKDIAALKKSVAALEGELKRLQGLLTKTTGAQPVKPADAKASVLRISSKGLKSLRRKLRVSQAELGQLANVTAQAVYLWERKSGVLKLRATTMESLSSLRSLGAREARALLNAMKQPKRKGGKKTR